MNREQLRQMILTGDDRMAHSPIWRFMSLEQQNLFLATEHSFQEDDAVTNTFLDKILGKLGS